LLTNIIPITVKAPALSVGNIDIILSRIQKIHPQIKKEGAVEYLCELLNIENLSDITGDFLLFQETQPAVSSSELHQLAQRILPYNDNDIHKAIFSARNILNTTPKHLNDLIDYVTYERQQAFIADVLNKTITGLHHPVGCVDTVEELAALLGGEDSLFIDMICSEQMEANQRIPQDELPGVTERQRMLYNAGNYYMNHLVGFECNTIWLACFMNSQIFGCSSGWLHRDGALCNAIHFGFKDEMRVPELVVSSKKYILSLFSAAIEQKKSNAQSELDKTVRLYIQTLIFSLEILLKQRLQYDADNHQDYYLINQILEDNMVLLDGGQKLSLSTIELIQQEGLGFTQEYFDLLSSFVEKHPDGEVTDKHLISMFDAWNFFVFDAHESKDCGLAPLFLKAKYYEEDLEKFSSILLDFLEGGELDDHNNNLFKGFFVNYLHMMVNENSDTHFLFDTIFNISVDAGGCVDNTHVILAMAELGHKKSMLFIAEERPKSEKAYWYERIRLV
jgi:uncharacterized protein YggL (DUF469 family)